jgi:hypothetical protein
MVIVKNLISWLKEESLSSKKIEYVSLLIKYDFLHNNYRSLKSCLFYCLFLMIIFIRFFIFLFFYLSLLLLFYSLLLFKHSNMNRLIKWTNKGVNRRIFVILLISHLNKTWVKYQYNQTGLIKDGRRIFVILSSPLELYYKGN